MLKNSLVPRAKRIHTIFLRFGNSMNSQQKQRFEKQITDLNTEIEEEYNDTEALEALEALEWLERIPLN